MSMSELLTNLDRQTLTWMIVGYVVIQLIALGFFLYGGPPMIAKVVMGTALVLHTALMIVLILLTI